MDVAVSADQADLESGRQSGSSGLGVDYRLDDTAQPRECSNAVGARGRPARSGARKGAARFCPETVEANCVATVAFILAVLSNDHRCQLELFNEQAEILLGSRFAAAMFSGPTVILKWVQGGPIEATGERPDAEAVRAFALTFRMFYRDGDGISFREMATVYEEPSVRADLRDAYRELRDGNQRFLDEKLAYTFNGQPIVQRELLEVFLWGGLAHVNPAKRKTYEAWRVDPTFFTLLSARFEFVLSQVCNYIRAIRDLNVRLLEAGAG